MRDMSFSIHVAICQALNYLCKMGSLPYFLKGHQVPKFGFLSAEISHTDTNVPLADEKLNFECITVTMRLFSYLLTLSLNLM